MSARAYLVTHPDGSTTVYKSKRTADLLHSKGHGVELMAPVGTLTDAQRKTVEDAVEYLKGQREPGAYHGIMTGLRAMLKP